jgi:hypothetical protein
MRESPKHDPREKKCRIRAREAVNLEFRRNRSSEDGVMTDLVASMLLCVHVEPDPRYKRKRKNIESGTNPLVHGSGQEPDKEGDEDVA